MKALQYPFALAGMAMLLAAGNVSADPIECPTDGELAILDWDRQASLDPALSCEFGEGNPNGSTFFGGGWSEQGETEGDDDFTGTLTDGFLTVEVLDGSWGADYVLALITIADGFWDMFGSGVISAHVGNTRGNPRANPDWFAWTVPSNTPSATFEYNISGFDTQGGGLSNIKLWGKDAPDITMSEPGTLGLLGIVVLGLGLVRRRKP